MAELNKPEGNPVWSRLLPGLQQLHPYKRQWLMRDTLAGISVCVVMIPSVIAYAGLMGLAPQHGLYAALIPLLAYPFFGSSRHVIVGPDIAISLLIASTVGPLAGGDPKRAAALAAIIALLTGALLLLGARAHFGAVADFLSKPVLVGYMTGAALILMASQLHTIFRIPLKHTEFFPVVFELAGKLPQAHWPTLGLGLVLMGLAFGMRRIAPKLPVALILCVLAIGASAALGLEQYGVKVVGSFPSGLPRFAWPALNWGDLQALLPAALGITLLTYTEGILLARAFAARNGYEVNANRELTALGLADLAAGCFQGFCITGSQARTTINEAAGAKTQMASLAAAGMLVLFLLFLTPLIARLPEAALAAILIFSAFGLVEFEVMKRIYRYYPRSGAVAALTTLCVLIAGVVPGILFGVALSLLGLINRISHPPDAVLTELPGRGFHDVGPPRQRQTGPGLIAYRFYAPLLFSNCGHFVERVRELILGCPTPVRWFLLDAQAITDIDVTAVEALHGLNEEFKTQGIALKIAHANPPLRALLERTGLAAEIGQDSFFASVHECVESLRGDARRREPVQSHMS